MSRTRYELSDLTDAAQSAGIITGCFSAFVVSSGSVLVTPIVIAQLASTRWDYNPDAVAALAEQTAYAQVGIGLVVISVVLQLATLCGRSDRAPLARRMFNWSVGAVVAVVISLAAWQAATARAETLRMQAEAILKAPPLRGPG